MNRELFNKTPWKIVTVFIGSVVFFFSYLLLSLALLSRDYPPLKSKQLYIIAFSVLSGTFWWVGNLQSNHIIEQDGMFQYCAIWVILVQYVLGVSLYLALIGFRMLRMYFILVLGRDPKGCKFWGILISFFAPSILLGLLAVALPNQILTVTPQIYPGHEEVGPFCYVPFKPYKLIMFGNTFLQLLLVLYLNKKVMDIRPAFNEFKENQLAFWILLTMLSASFGLNFGAHQVWYGKMIISFANLIASNVLVWVILAKPVWGCYRYPKEYLAQWKTGLRDENLPPQLLYGVRMNSILSF